MPADNAAHFPDSASASASFVRWLVAGVVLINLLVFGILVISLYQSFGEYQERAEVTVQNLAWLLAEDIGGDIEKIDVVLLTVEDEIEREVASGGINKRELNVFMARQQARLPEILGLRATDANGNVLYGLGVNPNARLNNSDREYFVRQRDNPKAGMVLAKPVFARIDKKWSVPLSRPVYLPDGTFGGVVYVNIGLDFLTNIFSTIDIGQLGSVSLRDAEQRIYARYPIPEEVDKVIGEKLAVPELQEMIRTGRDEGTYITSHTVDNVERKFAVHKINNLPLYAVVGSSTKEYMARWRDQAVKTSALAFLFCLSTLISARLIYRYMTDRRQAEEEVRLLNAELELRVQKRTVQLEAINRDIEEFSYSMSHDMRTPLRALDGFSKILLDEHGASLNDEGKRLLKVLRYNARRMGRLVDDILHFMDIGRQRMKFSRVDIAGMASEIFTELQSTVPERSLHLEIGPLPAAWCDREMIHEILQNLLSNAVKFSPGEGEVLIEIGGASEEEENVYSVTDHGVGFDMRYVDKLFRVFERVHPTGQYEGSGIGLALVKRIITRHGGRVWAKGKVNEGATIYFALPTKENNHE